MSASRSIWSLLLGRRGQDPTATELYGRLVAQARAEPFYARLGVPDTPEGRLELIMLHLVLVQDRLKAEGQEGATLARALSETFIADLDDCLREMAVSDLAVPRKVKKAAAALFDRSRDYGAALAAEDASGLARHIQRHILMVPEEGEGLETSRPEAVRIAIYAHEARRRIAATDMRAVTAGEISWPDVAG